MMKTGTSTHFITTAIIVQSHAHSIVNGFVNCHSNMKTPTHNSHEPATAGSLFTRVAHRWTRAVNVELQPLDLTYTQVALLAGIQELLADGKPVTQARLSTYTENDVMMMSKAVRVLEERGLLDRRDHPSDSRAKSLVLTKAGAALLKKAQRIVASVDDKFFQETSGLDKLRRTLKGIVAPR
ncbi:MAG: MarR family transcriptional regulator [Candidatus Kapabacteria bacterium]|nr:MarR family transcriptional regulator [Candidatus Kapabacteria bacterium]